MKTVVRRSVLLGLAAFVAALGLFVAGGALRLWPRIAGQHLPMSLIWPFVRPLLAAALELSFLVSVPVAAALVAAWRAPPSGMGRWQRSLASAGLLVLGLGTLSFGMSQRLDGGGSSPGELATELVTSARQSCIESTPRAEVAVPLLGFSWVCEAGRAPRLQGRAPLGKEAHFQASKIVLSDDLKQIALTEFVLGFPVSTLHVQVHTAHATLSGLPPWGRSRRMPLTLRAFLFALSSGLAALALAGLVERQAWLPRWAAGLLGASVSGCLWFAVSWLERQEPRPSSYLVLPASGLASVLLSACAVHLGRRLWLRLRGARPSAPSS